MKSKKEIKKPKTDLITSDDILGKEAVDSEGTILGTVTKLHISNKNNKIIGISIDMGLLSPDLFVGINHVKYFGIDTILLKSVPAVKFKNKIVKNHQGIKLGKVYKIETNDENNKNQITAIIIKPKLISTKDNFKVKYDQIKEIGNSIILKKHFIKQKINKKSTIKLLHE